jgi:hypothetical protein
LNCLPVVLGAPYLSSQYGVAAIRLRFATADAPKINERIVRLSQAV